MVLLWTALVPGTWFDDAGSIIIFSAVGVAIAAVGVLIFAVIYPRRARRR